MAEGEAVETGQQPLEAAGPDQQAGAERSDPNALARALLLEAVDAIGQAKELLGDDEAGEILSRHALDLSRLASRLSR